jgi:hypothetical protein
MVTTALAVFGLLALRVGVPLIITLTLSELLLRLQAGEYKGYGH